MPCRLIAGFQPSTEAQEELAERANLHWTYLSDLERGRQSPTVDVVNRLARALGVSLAEFFRTVGPALPGSVSQTTARLLIEPLA